MADDERYTLNMAIRVQGYGTDKQAAQMANRVRQMLNVALHQFVNVTDIEVKRP